MTLTLDDNQREIVLNYVNANRQQLLGTISNGGVASGNRGTAGAALINHCHENGILYKDFKHFMAQHTQWKAKAYQNQTKRDGTGAKANPKKPWENIIFCIETAMGNPKFDPSLEVSKGNCLL